MDNFGKLNAAIYRNMQAILHFKLRHLGISSGQYSFFYLIGRHSGITQKELTERMHVEKSTTAKAIKILESKGFIQRSKDADDRRMERLSLTAKGAESIESLNRAFADNLVIAARDLNPGERDKLIDILGKVLQSLTEEKSRLYSSLDNDGVNSRFT